MRLKYLFMFLMLFGILSKFSFAANNTFGCQNEYCLFNITTQLWSCHYEFCNRMPNLTVVNQTNITVIENHSIVINTTDVSINLTTVDCNELRIIESIENITTNFTGRVEEQYRLAGLYSDCKTSRNTLQQEITECSNKNDNFAQNYMPKDQANYLIGECKSNATAVGVELVKTQDSLAYYGVGGFIGGVVLLWFFKVRKPDIESSRSSVVPPIGEIQADFRGMEEDARKVQDRYSREDRFMQSRFNNDNKGKIANTIKRVKKKLR